MLQVRMAKTLQYTSVLSVDLQKIDRTARYFEVILEEGLWPTDEDLIQLVDGGDPSNTYHQPLNGGGIVCPGEDDYHKIVKVYI